MLSAIRRLEKDEFTLWEIYAFAVPKREPRGPSYIRHPNNKHLEPKIRPGVRNRDYGVQATSDNKSCAIWGLSGFGAG